MGAFEWCWATASPETPWWCGTAVSSWLGAGVSTRPDGNAGVIVAEVPVGAADHHLTIEVVGRLMSGSAQLATDRG